MPAKRRLRYRWRYQFPIGRSTNGTFVDLVTDRLVSQAWGYGLHALSLEGVEAWAHHSETPVHYFVWRDRLFTGGDVASCLSARTGDKVAVRPCRDDREVRVLTTTSNCAIYWEHDREGERKHGALLGLSPDDLTELWSIPDSSGAMRVLDGHVYAFDAAASEVVVRLPPRTEPVARYAAAAEVWHYMPLAADGVLVFAPSDSIQAFDALNGERLWTRSRSGVSYGFDRIVGGVLYLLEDKLSAVDPRTGREQWRLGVEAEVSDLAVGRDVVWVSTRNRRLRAIDRQTGRVQILPIELGAGVLKMWALSDDELLLLVTERGQVREAVWRITVE